MYRAANMRSGRKGGWRVQRRGCDGHGRMILHCTYAHAVKVSFEFSTWAKERIEFDARLQSKRIDRWRRMGHNNTSWPPYFSSPK